MGWLSNRPQVSAGQTLYTSSLSQTKLIVGLGNIGKEYDMTRHNIGFYCLDDFVGKTDGMENWSINKSLKCEISTGRIADCRIIAIKPTTFMNLSGEAVQAALNFYKIPLQDLVVIHDELDIDFGNIRMRKGGSSAGHNGIKNISQMLSSEDYSRIRIGVGPKKPATAKSETFVLKKFSSDEQAQLPNMLVEINSIINESIFSKQPLNETRSFLL
jgi:PTH1 family peptidyl-tRNA hydrolase